VPIFELRFSRDWFTLAPSMLPKFRPSRLPIPVERPLEQRLHQGAGWAATGLSLLSFLVLVWQMLPAGTLVPTGGGSCAVFLIATALGTLLTQSRQIPGFKVLWAALIIGLGGGAAHWIGAATNLPFGPLIFSEHSGPKIAGKLSWAMPWLWIIVLLNARGVARLMLRPWRKTRPYGFWVIGITTVLVTLLVTALDPFATRVGQYWLWLPTRFPVTWFNMPWSNALGWALITLLLLAFVTPLLVNRSSRARKLPPNYQPLLVWGLLLILCALGAGIGRLWTALGFDVLLLLLTTHFAVRGARW